MAHGVGMRADVLIQHLAAAYPEVTHGRWKAEACLPASAMALRVLAAFAIRARAVPVQLMCYNPAWAARLLEERPAPRSPEEAREWAEAGCYSVGIGFPMSPTANDPGHWNAHMVVVTDSPLLQTQVLIDLTLGQAARPAKGMDLAPTLIYPVVPGFEDGAPVMLQDVQGSLLAYSRHPNPPPWESLHTWSPYYDSVTETRFMRALTERGVPMTTPEAVPPPPRMRKVRRRPVT